MTLICHTLLVVVACLALYVSARSMEDQRIQLEFETECSRVDSRLIENLDVYHEVVQGIASFYAGSDNVSRPEFNAFVHRALTQHRGIHALEWIPRIPADDRQRLERTAQADGFPDFQFRQWNPGGRWTVSPEQWADDYYPVYFMQPHLGNEAVLGIDLGSNPIRRRAMETAANTGRAVATSAVPLAQEAESQSGFLLFVPIYRNDSPIETQEQRRQNLAGFALGVFRIGDIVDEVLDVTSEYDFSLKIAEAGGMTLYDSDAGGSNSDSEIPRQALCRHQSQCCIGGRCWQLQFDSHPEWVAAQRASLAVPFVIAGSVVALLLGSLLHTITERAARVAQLVGERTTELEKANHLIREQRDSLTSTKHVLEESNQQLKEFAYAASHDLQTPLRGVANYAQFLKEDYGATLDPTGNDYVDRIISSADRMRELILHLLEYSRVESQAHALQPTDLNLVFQDVLDLLHDEIESAAATITCEPLPTVNCDMKQIAQIFRNLLTNALKYRSPRSPQIHVSASHDDMWTISVQDNGIGIEKRFQSHVFDIFRRLHTQQEYPGTGIGLALCRRIVQRHGGAIHVESEADCGSKFVFTLPEAKAKANMFSARTREVLECV